MNGKYQSEIADCNLELTKIKGWIDNNKLHSNVKYLVSYSVIKACGTIENVFKEMIFDHLTHNANNEATAYFTNNITNSSCNPSSGQITKILQQINGEWAENFENAIKGSNQKGQLKSLVRLRNSFSHGDSITSSIDEVIRFFIAGCWVLEKLHETIYT